MTIKTYARYKFSLVAHPGLQSALNDQSAAMAATGKTDGQNAIPPVYNPATDDLVVVREWSTLEHAQEWSDAWNSAMENYVLTEDGASIVPGSYSIEIQNS